MGDNAPLIPTMCDASVPDTPFVRADVLRSYRRARDDGLPEISRKSFHLLNYAAAITRAFLLRRNLREDSEECWKHLFFSDVNADGRIIRPPTGMKPSGMQDVHGVTIHGGLQTPVGTPIPDYKAALADVGCEGRSAPRITVRAISGEFYECDFKRMVQ